MTAALGTFDGTLTTIRAHERGADGKPNPTYRCLFPEPPPPGTVPACAEAGILGALAGVVGSMMALEVIREIVGFGEGLVGRLVMLDARAMRFETLRYAWDPANPLTGEQPTIRDLVGAPLRQQLSLRPHRDMVEPFITDHLLSPAVTRVKQLAMVAAPGGAEAVLRQLPGAFALVAGARRSARASSCRRPVNVILYLTFDSVDAVNG